MTGWPCHSEWTPEGLARFLHCLGPEMQKRDVNVFFGTLERGNPRMLATVMADPDAARFIKGVGTQWAGKARFRQSIANFRRC